MKRHELNPLERIVAHWPVPVLEVVVALSAIGLAVTTRLVLEQFVEGAVPFALTFPAVIAAALLAGGRAGALAIIGCQLLVWYFVMPPKHSFVIVSTGQAVTLILTTAAQFAAVWAIAAYRNASHRLQQESARQVELLSIALKEIDHRTKNNFQVAASLLTSQAASATDPGVANELRHAASRLASIASTYKNLALSSANISSVLLHEHLREICEQLRVGMLPMTVSLRFRATPVTVPAEIAVSIGLIVNEWITNAVRHAFPDAIGEIAVSAHQEGEEIAITVEDNGVGGEPAVVKGRGSNLVTLLAQSIDAKITVTRGKGTTCILRAPASRD